MQSAEGYGTIRVNPTLVNNKKWFADFNSISISLDSLSGLTSNQSGITPPAEWLVHGNNFWDLYIQEPFYPFLY